MTKTAVLAVLLFATLSACSSDDGTDGTTITARQAGRPDTAELEPGLRIVDLDTFPKARGFDRPTPCNLPVQAVGDWAEANLECGSCFALMCDGDLYAHVCTHQCDITNDPGGVGFVPPI